MSDLTTFLKLMELHRRLDENAAARARFEVAVAALSEISEEGLTAEEAGMTAAVALDKIELLVKNG